MFDMATILLIIIYVMAIGLGVPDSALGAAWPTIFPEMGVDMAMVNCVSAIVSCGTILSSLFSSRLINRFGTAKITALSTSITALALAGYAISPNLAVICLFAIPLGLGAGAVDTAINNYMALHYKAMFMNFMHCFYGLGVIISPSVMSFALAHRTWRFGYLVIAGIQGALAIISIFAIPLWGKVKSPLKLDISSEVRSPKLRELFSNSAIRFACLFLFCSTSIEALCTVWSGSFLVETKGFSSADAASYLVLYYIGLTVGRLISGILTTKVPIWTLLRSGQGLVLLGAAIILFGVSPVLLMVGLFCVGCGIAPQFPGLLYLTPHNFGIDISQSVTGVEMAFSYCGTLLTPIVFGFITNAFSTDGYTIFLLLFTICLAFVHTLLRMRLRKSV